MPSDGFERGRQWSRRVPGTGRSKLVAFLILVVGAYVAYQEYGKLVDRRAMRYFHEQCEKHGGEFIYRTVDNVEGVFQMRPRDPRDYFDRLRKGDIPEDPYGHTNVEAIDPETIYVRPNRNTYRFFERKTFGGETKNDGAGEFRHFFRESPGQRPVPYRIVEKPESRYGYTWRQEQSKADLTHGVLRGATEVIDMSTGEVLGVKRGFFIRRPFDGVMSICPKEKDDLSTYRFVSKVLVPRGD